ncbi:LysR family transcriptional regulator [Yersinia enterocolitica]|uniref:LysR family transcriptional regulator n=1 Tax=Yersinia enterocolitica TaxID=630 RepID=UPI0009B5AC6A|nr:LysR family transcriptional regulator [Yersinia enterocolitica]ELI7921282.1 LysR family transcriptional regulator [Yersinia enterocolitica]HEN3613771.1 LysR family transcriptional regulator [Yersinia enterocolitica]
MQKQFDYNLIKFLVAVVDARSMSAASEQLDLAPSGISHAIGKLREYYNDPIFIKVKNGVQPTSLARHLYEMYKPIIEMMEVAINVKNTYQASNNKKRIYQIRANSLIEYWLSYFVLQDTDILDHCKLNFVRYYADQDDRVIKLRSKEVDLDIGIAIGYDANIYSKHLFDIDYSIICCRDHPRIGDQISREDFMKEKHMAWSSQSYSTGQTESMEEFLAERNKNILISSESYLPLICLVQNSDLLMLVPAYIIGLLLQNFNLKEVKCDFLKKRSSHVYAYIHKTQRHDKNLLQLIDIIQQKL